MIRSLMGRLLAFLIIGLLSSAPIAAQQVDLWSQTPASNATADPAINWAVGMAPSAVSPSARAMMAAIAKWRDDFSGLVVTTGTSTAYVASSNTGFNATPNNGQLFVIQPNVINGAAVTLQVDSGTAFPIQCTPGTPVIAGTLQAGTPYPLVFNTSQNSWILWSCFAADLGGGSQTSIAGASTTDLWSVSSDSILITGTSGTINQLANADAPVGTLKLVQFQSAGLVLTQGTPLTLPNNGGNITVQAGDTMVVISITTTNVLVLNYTRATGAALFNGAVSMNATSIGYNQPINLQIGASTASNQLTVAVNTADTGSTPSATDPVLVPFRTANVAAGNQFFGAITAPTSFTLASTSSMGCTTTVKCRLWGELICQSQSFPNCTSVLIGLSVQSNSTSCSPLNEASLITTGGGTNGGTAINTIQTSVAGVSGAAFRIAFYVEATWTSGTGWSSPTVVQLFGPGVNKPCSIVGGTSANIGTVATGTHTYTASNTAPTTANSDLALSAPAYTPTSAVNIIRVRAQAVLGVNAAMVAWLYNGTSNVATSPAGITGQASPAGVTLPVYYRALAGSTNPITFSLYYSATAAATLNGYASSQFFGGTADTYIEVDEIMGALDVPVNDNGLPLSMVG